jgi:hypothetical protein
LTRDARGKGVKKKVKRTVEAAKEAVREVTAEVPNIARVKIERARSEFLLAPKKRRDKPRSPSSITTNN